MYIRAENSAQERIKSQIKLLKASIEYTKDALEKENDNLIIDELKRATKGANKETKLLFMDLNLEVLELGIEANNRVKNAMEKFRKEVSEESEEEVSSPVISQEDAE